MHWRSPKLGTLSLLLTDELNVANNYAENLEPPFIEENNDDQDISEAEQLLMKREEGRARTTAAGTTALPVNAMVQCTY